MNLRLTQSNKMPPKLLDMTTLTMLLKRHNKWPCTSRSSHVSYERSRDCQENPRLDERSRDYRFCYQRHERSNINKYEAPSRLQLLLNSYGWNYWVWICSIHQDSCRQVYCCLTQWMGATFLKELYRHQWLPRQRKYPLRLLLFKVENT